MKPDADPLEKFEGWFVKSIAKLKELPEGDGAIAALIIAFPLHERYIRAKLKLENQPTDDDSLNGEIAADLKLTSHQASVFRDVYRNGLLHGAMPKKGKTGWMISHQFGETPTFQVIDGIDCICLDPWKFADRVLRMFDSDHRLVTASESFPLGVVVLHVSNLSTSSGT